MTIETGVMKKYNELDAAILQNIQSGVRLFSSICAAVDGISRQHSSQNTAAWRVVDRRLQAMRKAGKIVYLRTGWVST